MERNLREWRDWIVSLFELPNAASKLRVGDIFKIAKLNDYPHSTPKFLQQINLMIVVERLRVEGPVQDITFNSFVIKAV